MIKRELTASEVRRVADMQSRYKRELTRQFNKFLLDSEGTITARLASLLQVNKLSEVFHILDEPIAQFSNALTDLFIDAGHREMDFLVYSKAIRSSKLDITTPKISQVLARNKQNFSGNLSLQQQNILREATIAGIRAGLTVDQLAQKLRRVIGLNAQQQRAVDTYQRSLEQGSSDALRRTLRDPTFDATISNVIDSDSVLSANQIERMVGGYSRKLQQARAQTIAETETLKIMNQGRYSAVAQLVEVTGARGMKTWLHTSAAEPRQSHLAIVGDTIPVDEAFDVGGAQLLYPGDTSLGAGPDQIVNCACGIHYSISEE